MSNEQERPQGRGHRRSALRSVAAVAAVVATLATLAPQASTSTASPDTLRQACSTSAVLGDARSVDAIEAAAQQDFLSRLNALRSARGLGALAWNEAMNGPSIAWSQTMSTQIPPGGSAADPGWLHHARDTGDGDGVSPSQDYVNVNSRLVGNWRRLAENVGVGGMRQSCSVSDLEANTDRVVLALHDAFVASPGHLHNMVGDHNQVAIGVHIDADEMWVTVRFANGDLPRNPTAAVTASVASYVDAVYGLFAGRRATGDEARWWAGAVQSGDRKALTGALAVSDAWAGGRVNDMYRTILGRSADSRGRSYWVSQVARGLQLESAAVEFFGSSEYYVRAGGNPRAFVASLYDDLLGRSGDRAGIDYWLSLMQRGSLSRSGVADNFYRSVESRRDRVERLHRTVLGTSPSAGERDRWADRLAYVGDINLAAELAASSAFWNKAVS